MDVVCGIPAAVEAIEDWRKAGLSFMTSAPLGRTSAPLDPATKRSILELAKPNSVMAGEDHAAIDVGEWRVTINIVSAEPGVYTNKKKLIFVCHRRRQGPTGMDHTVHIIEIHKPHPKVEYEFIGAGGGYRIRFLDLFDHPEMYPASAEWPAAGAVEECMGMVCVAILALGSRCEPQVRAEIAKYTAQFGWDEAQES